MGWYWTQIESVTRHIVFQAWSATRLLPTTRTSAKPTSTFSAKSLWDNLAVAVRYCNACSGLQTRPKRCDLFQLRHVRDGREQRHAPVLWLAADRRRGSGEEDPLPGLQAADQEDVCEGTATVDRCLKDFGIETEAIFQVRLYRVEYERGH